MKFVANLLVLSLLALPACSGVGSVTKKQYQNTENTIVLKNLTASDFDLQDAGSQLQDAIENAMADTSYTLAGESARYTLKYKILEFDEGSRMVRIATMGFSDSAKAKLKVKAALFDGRDMVGAWEVDSWVKGGLTGGTEEKLFERAAKEITGHLKGNF